MQSQHALRWIASRSDSQTTQVIMHPRKFTELVTKNGKVGWEAQTGTRQCSAFTLEGSCGCTILDMPESREITEQIDWRAKATLTSGSCLGRYEALRRLIRYLRAAISTL